MPEGFSYGGALRSGRGDGTQGNRKLEIENLDLQIGHRALSDSEMSTGVSADPPLHSTGMGQEETVCTRPRRASNPPLHQMERGSGGEAARASSDDSSCSPSPLAERGL